MTTKHTPGPWYFAVDDAGPENEWGNRERAPVDPATYEAPGCYNNIGLDGADGQPIIQCSEYDVFYGATPEERAANICLIAAAPDLLTVARVALTWYEHPAVHDAFRADEVLYKRLNDAIQGTRAAIQKAKGGA